MDKDILELLKSISEGNMNAFGEIYDKLSVRIFNHARAIVRTKELSEDITHDVFLKILANAARLTKMRNPVAYIKVYDVKGVF